MNTPLSEEKFHQLKDAIRSGRTIEAIKLHRDATGCSLVDAKEFVTKLEAQLRTEEPGMFPAKPATSGCLTAFLGFFVVVGLAFFLPGAWAIGSHLLFAIGAEEAQGVVVKHLHDSPFPWPTKVVLRSNGREIELTPSSKIWGRNRQALGTRLSILVRQDRPGEARVGSRRLYSHAGLFCVLGGGMMALPLFGFWLSRRAAKSMANSPARK